jgi:hypothetical protein
MAGDEPPGALRYLVAGRYPSDTPRPALYHSARTLRPMQDDTKDHFKLLHEALEQTNSALEDLHTHVHKDDSEADAAFQRKLTAAKESLHKADEDLKKHM